MGKLRSAIDNVVKTTGTLEKAAEQLLDGRSAMTDQFMVTLDFCLSGTDTLYMYLTEKFKKAASNIAQQQQATLKDVMDPNVAKMVQEILAARSRLAKKMAERDKVLAVGKALKTNVEKLLADLAAIQSLIDKKKKKWLLSPQYKNKLKGYETAVADLNTSLTALHKQLPGKGFGSMVNPDKWNFSAATTVADIYNAASTSLTQDMALTKKEDDEQAKKFRGRGFGKSLATLKSWIDEADDMEKVD